MAKKNNKVVIENIELKPQVIGTVQKKKNNIGRVLVIFVVFILTILYLPNVTVYINDLLGIETSSSILDINNDDTEEPKKDNEISDSKEISYTLFNETAEINNGDYKVNNFLIVNNELSFNVVNNLDKRLDLSKERLYLETYNENKTLINRYKVDVNVLGAKKSETLKLSLNNPTINYITFVSKTVNDYPVIELKKDDLGYSKIACNKNSTTYTYTFKNDELVKVKEEIIYNFNVTDINYTNEFNKYQSKCTSYDVIKGIDTSFNNSTNGFTAVIDVDLTILNKDDVDEKYYYSYKEMPKVVNFEMQTYGFSCK